MRQVVWTLDAAGAVTPGRHLHLQRLAKLWALAFRVGVHVWFQCAASAQRFEWSRHALPPGPAVIPTAWPSGVKSSRTPPPSMARPIALILLAIGKRRPFSKS